MVHVCVFAVLAQGCSAQSRVTNLRDWQKIGCNASPAFAEHLFAFSFLISMDFFALKARVVDRITDRVYGSMRRYVVVDHPSDSFWGLEKPANFVESVLIYTVYTDLHRCGAHKLVSKIGDRLGYKLNSKSVLHNSAIVRRQLNAWASQHIILGDQHAWNHAARDVFRPNSLQVGTSQGTTRTCSLDRYRG